MVILLSLIVSAIGGTMLMMSNADHQIAANERDAERALFAAKAGVNYAFHLFQEGLITPTSGGAAFNSFASSVGTPLKDADFTGRIFDLSSTLAQGQLFSIQSTGTYNRASRTTEVVFQIVPESFKFGYMAFSEATLHNHSGLAGPSFRIESTIMSNGSVDVPKSITIDGTIVSSGDVSIDTGSTVTRDIFANDVSNSGTIGGKVRLLTSVADLPASAVSWDRVDSFGNKYEWLNGNSSPGGFSGTAPAGGTSSYTIQDDDDFLYNIFNRNGFLLPDPDVNVTKYVPPPQVDYAGMKAEADLNDPTYFTSQADAVNYLISKKVAETIGGRNVTTVRVGTADAPEFLYIDDDFELTLDPGGSDDAGSAEIAADGIFIEGGIYVSGSFDFDGPDFMNAVPQYPLPPDYYMLSINALPHCYPALLVYEEPSVAGTPATWTPDDTPPMGGGSSLKMSGGTEGPSYFNGVVLGQADIHLHHTSDPRELIRFNGAELSWKIHNCDYFWFSYDPQVRCTRFLLTSNGTPEIVSYREVR
jgi:cytoskeletal protein CcmA (bactofilin family)